MSDSTVEFGPYTFNPDQGTVDRADGLHTKLTRFESSILAQLVAQPGKAISKNELNQKLYGAVGNRVMARKTNTIEVFIKRIRRKIDPDGILYPVRTIRYVGYMLRADIQLPAVAA